MQLLYDHFGKLGRNTEQIRPKTHSPLYPNNEKFRIHLPRRQHLRVEFNSKQYRMAFKSEKRPESQGLEKRKKKGRAKG